MRNTLREFLKLSRPLHSVSVVAKQAPLALSNAKVSCKHGLWLVVHIKKIRPKLGTDKTIPQPPCFSIETSTILQRTGIRDFCNGKHPWKPNK